ncbi:MAG TPA: hypothetical protein VGC21_17245 [Telluria sp.]
MTDTELRCALHAALRPALPALCDHTLEQMKHDVAQGWRFFYARPWWAYENAPGPHLNEPGRRYMAAAIWSQMHTDPATGASSVTDPALRDFWRDRAQRVGYRNLFQTGTLDLESSGPNNTVADEVVNQTAHDLLLHAHRHVKFEIIHNVHAWYLEAVLGKGTLTPEPAIWERDAAVPVRDESEPLAQDYRYWQAVYQLRRQIVADGVANAHVQTKPDTALALMAQLAPDFPYAPALSTPARLVFVQQGASATAWALVIEKVDRAREYTYPPRLILIARDLNKKLKDQHMLLTHAESTGGRATPLWPREVEINIRFHLQRLRSMMDFYAPWIAPVLAAAG